MGNVSFPLKSHLQLLLCPPPPSPPPSTPPRLEIMQAVGVGGSWNEDLFCAGTDASALNLVMTEQEHTLALWVLGASCCCGGWR